MFADSTSLLHFINFIFYKIIKNGRTFKKRSSWKNPTNCSVRRSIWYHRRNRQIRGSPICRCFALIIVLIFLPQYSIWMPQLNEDINIFQRSFINEVKRCNAIEKQLSYIEDLVFAFILQIAMNSLSSLTLFLFSIY